MARKPLSKSAIRRAKKIVAKSRQTHVAWLKFYERHPTERVNYMKVAGGIAHHRRCIAGYDHVLAVLRAMGNRGQ